MIERNMYMVFFYLLLILDEVNNRSTYLQQLRQKSTVACLLFPHAFLRVGYARSCLAESTWF